MLGPVEIAKRLNVSRTHVYKLIRTGELPGVVKLGSIYRMPEELLERLCAAEGEGADTNLCSYTPGAVLPDPLTPEALEQVRRSIAMLTPRQPSGLDREAALALLEELQRLQGADRRLNELVEALRVLLAAAAPSRA